MEEIVTVGWHKARAKRQHAFSDSVSGGT